MTYLLLQFMEITRVLVAPIQAFQDLNDAVRTTTHFFKMGVVGINVSNKNKEFKMSENP